MIAGFAPDRSRRLLVVLLAWLVALQAFLAGVVGAQAGALAVSGAADGIVICHTAGGAGSPDSTEGDAAKAWHLCCAGCAASAVAVPAAPDAAIRGLRAITPLLPASAFIVIAARGSIRAGPSQAPPASA